MIRASVPLLLAVALAACAGAAPGPVASQQPVAASKPPATPVTLSKAQVTALHAGVRKTLKDPESARFGEHRAGRDADGTITVCGLVNAKNSYGGYTGEKPYLAALATGGAVVIGMGGTDIQTQAVLQVCRENGLAL